MGRALFSLSIFFFSCFCDCGVFVLVPVVQLGAAGTAASVALLDERHPLRVRFSSLGPRPPFAFVNNPLLPLRQVSLV